jgi:hypothetical protein
VYGELRFQQGLALREAAHAVAQTRHPAALLLEEHFLVDQIDEGLWGRL